MTFNGEIHITLKTSGPFGEWEIGDLAMDLGMIFLGTILQVTLIREDLGVSATRHSLQENAVLSNLGFSQFLYERRISCRSAYFNQIAQDYDISVVPFFGVYFKRVFFFEEEEELEAYVP